MGTPSFLQTGFEFKLNSFLDDCWQENRTESFSNQASEEGPTKEIAATVRYSKAISLLLTIRNSCPAQRQGTFF